MSQYNGGASGRNNQRSSPGRYSDNNDSMRSSHFNMGQRMDKILGREDLDGQRQSPLGRSKRGAMNAFEIEGPMNN